MTTENIPTKSRFDVIDTALQQQQELRVLRYLLLLFVITVAYEYGQPLIWPEEGPDVASPISIPRRITLPTFRIERFARAFSGLIRENPQLKEPLERDRINLSRILEEMAAGPLTPESQKDFLDLMTRFWNFSHLQIWDNPEIFKEINLEIKTLFGVLSRKPDESYEPPEINFWPKILGEMDAPKRDIFNFSK